MKNLGSSYLNLEEYVNLVQVGKTSDYFFGPERM